MIDKFIQSDSLCINIGHPTPLGWVILVGLVIISVIAFVKNRK